MKKLVLAAAFAGAASTAFAGGMSEPVMEPEIIIEETQPTGTLQGIIVPLILIALVAAAASN